LSLYLSLVKDIADTISKARGGQGVGIKWSQRFIKRTLALETQIGRKHEC
ncbi:hypothetical protein M433DRAFT_161428, partial [Acidomyces richmondensis BFW]